MAEFLKGALNELDKAQQFLNNNNPLVQSPGDGFGLPASYSADGNGLPSSKVPNNKPAQMKRNIITWFVPEFGIVRMYVNPSKITYNHKKLIGQAKTKGGFSLSYWGEDLTTLNISGTTGSSGVEGINVLYEIYRAEQYAFDGLGLTLAANNASADIANNLATGAAAGLGGAVEGLFGATTGAVAGGLLGGVLGLDSPNNTLAAKNIPSLGQLAFTVEMFYAGWVYRGFFQDMVINESAENFLMEYNMTFIATQKRGYRSNRFGWERSAVDGPSNYTTPYSFNGNIDPGQ